MQVSFKVIRQTQHTAPTVQSYVLDVEPSTTILDCLHRIKWGLDGTLAFRRNCRNTICGSCAMRINGRSALACKENVGHEISRFGQDGTPEISVAPLGNLPVIKDLVVDMQAFWSNLEAIDPYISTAARQIPEREFLQTPAQRDALNQMGNCIMCGACYSECNAAEVNADFVGPHALAKAYRLIADNRDHATDERLEHYNQGTDGVWGCTRCGYCNSVCPMEVAPLDQISKIKQAILKYKDEQASRAIRHRKQLVKLVKQGGWVDERKFGLNVVGNQFKDWQGVLSLLPLGWEMLRRGKFPGSFHPSEGTAEVRSLMEAVEAQEAAMGEASDPSQPGQR